MVSTIAKILEIIGVLFTNIGVLALFRHFHLNQTVARFIRTTLTNITRISHNSQTSLYHRHLETWLTNWFISAVLLAFLLLLGLIFSQDYLRFVVWLTILFYIPLGFLIMLALSNLLPLFLGAVIYYPLKYLIYPFYLLEKYIKEHHLEMVIILIGVVISIIAVLIE
jgi:hypothetical protein